MRTRVTRALVVASLLISTHAFGKELLKCRTVDQENFGIELTIFDYGGAYSYYLSTCEKPHTPGFFPGCTPYDDSGQLVRAFAGNPSTFAFTGDKVNIQESNISGGEYDFNNDSNGLRLRFPASDCIRNSIGSAVNLTVNPSEFIDTAIIGKGQAYSSLPPDCDDKAIFSAGASADQDASQRCQIQPKRTSNYTVKCEILVHGYAARALVTANYSCEK